MLQGHNDSTGDVGHIEINTFQDLLRLLCFQKPAKGRISNGGFKASSSDPFLRLLEDSDAVSEAPPNPNRSSAFVSSKRQRKATKPSRVLLPPPISCENRSDQVCTREKQEEDEENEEEEEEEEEEDDDDDDDDDEDKEEEEEGEEGEKDGTVQHSYGKNALENHMLPRTNRTNALHGDRMKSGKLNRTHSFRGNGMKNGMIPEPNESNSFYRNEMVSYANGKNAFNYDNGMKNGILPHSNGSNDYYGKGMQPKANESTDYLTKNRMTLQPNGNTAIYDADSKKPTSNFVEKRPLHVKSTKVCKNLACKAKISSEDAFCRRCSCSICEKFDDNKDPSLWILCNTEIGGCGLSCHIECALEHDVAGVGGLIKKIPPLDGSFFCQFCGTVTPLIGSWEKQLRIAKDARRVDIFRDRLLLSHRLFRGTKQHKDYHSLIDEAVSKLETEVSKMGAGSNTLSRCIVNRLSCIAEVQKLIDLAIQKAEASKLDNKEDGNLSGYKSAPCIVHFENVSSTSIVISVSDNAVNIKAVLLGYKLWHRRTSDPSYACAPSGTVCDVKATFKISNLLPLTEYTFKVVLFTAEGDLMHSEARCCTKGIEEMKPPFKIYSAMDVVVINTMNEGTSRQTDRTFDMNYRIDELENGSKSQDADYSNGFLSASDARTHFVSSILRNGAVNGSYSQIDDDDSTKDIIDCNQAPQGWAMQIHSKKRQREVFEGFTYSNVQSMLNYDAEAEFKTFEFSVKVIRWLECEGHLKEEFRMKFLTWYTLRATKHEKRVVSVFIGTLGDDPISLAGQLVDAFEDIVHGR